jgi:S-DNA-T family DNA segregation ATPase FtsK/SpoIIIE
MSARKVKRRHKNKNKANEIGGVLLIALGALSIVAVYLNFDSVFGDGLKKFIFGLFGAAGYAVPVILIAIGVVVIAARKKNANPGKLLLIVLVLVFVMSLLHVSVAEKIGTSGGFASYAGESYKVGSMDHAGGGVIGSLLTFLCMLYLGAPGSYIALLTAIVVCVIALTNLSLKKMGVGIGNAVKNKYDDYRAWAEEYKKSRQDAELYVEDLNESENDRTFEENPFDIKVETGPNEIKLSRLYKGAQKAEPRIEVKSFDEFSQDISIDDEDEPEQDNFKDIFTGSDIEFDEEGIAEQKEKRRIIVDKPSDTENTVEFEPIKETPEYFKPPISLLATPKSNPGKGKTVDIKKNADMLENTLSSFGIVAKVVSVSRGPVVTRYELQPAPGVKVSRIVNLADDIALNFAVAGVRIEAPIPGKAAVGIEVPNEEVLFVPIRELLGAEKFNTLKSPVSFALGKDIAGENVFGDINKMPHLLIAGATGSGKSVCVNSLIVSILYKATPKEVRMIMIDPKVVELNVFNNIPHLLAPVVTDPKKAASSINWAVNEMTMRYRMFALQGAKDLQRYNAIVEKEGKEKLPAILVIIDELADLMMVSAKEVEDAICRIAQLGRACGIHLVIATQRPSVDVITGLIKANIPSRIAFAVSSQVDSRTILDIAGAEKLLGQGDMLYYPTGAPKPMRLQGCFINDKEVEAVTNFLKNNVPAEYDEKVVEGLTKEAANPIAGEEETDDLLQKAVELVVEYEQASISMLQRRLRVGYARAARLIDEMEIRGIVSGFEGSKPRQVLINKQDLDKLFNTQAEGEM